MDKDSAKVALPMPAVEPMAPTGIHEESATMARTTPPPPPRSDETWRRCIVQEGRVRCPRPVAIMEHGLCTAHYKRFRRNKDVGSPLIGKWQRLDRFRLDPSLLTARPVGCRFRGCDQPVIYRKLRLCRGHYSWVRAQQQKHPNELIRPRRKKRSRVT